LRIDATDLSTPHLFTVPPQDAVNKDDFYTTAASRLISEVAVRVEASLRFAASQRGFTGHEKQEKKHTGLQCK